MVAPAQAPVVSFRPGGPADRPYMVELAEDTFRALGDYRAIIDQWLDVPRVRSLVLERAGRRVGFALVAEHRGLGFWRPVTAELVAIVLDPAARGRGLGRALLRAAAREAESFGARELRLHTADDNTIAQSLFVAEGYEIRACRETYYPNGQLAIEMRRTLSAGTDA